MRTRGRARRARRRVAGSNPNPNPNPNPNRNRNRNPNRNPNPNPNPNQAAAAAELERLHADGFVGVRFNPYLFPDGLDSPVGHALYKKAGCAPGLGGVGAAWHRTPRL